MSEGGCLATRRRLLREPHWAKFAEPLSRYFHWKTTNIDRVLAVWHTSISTFVEPKLCLAAVSCRTPRRTCLPRTQQAGQLLFHSFTRVALMSQWSKHLAAAFLGEIRDGQG
ncbi:unnamed protein product [Effrenium voratum]|nr:unnamed protein product [Effrenium voratum]